MPVETERTMGRKKKSDGTGPARKKVGFTMKASEEWMSWLNQGAKSVGLPASSLVEQAVRKYLKAQGYDEPPPER